VGDGANRVLIVGGGVIGTACAYFLARDGWQVTLVERGAFGMGCSHANCGFVSPSHVLPLAVPGAIGPALRSLLQPASPFRVKPRFDPALWTWLYRFARRCNPADMMESARAIQALLNSSRRLYDELIRDESLECEWQPRGNLLVFASRERLDHYAETDKLLRDEFNMGAVRFEGEALTRMEPALKPRLAGAYFYEADAHVRPDRLLDAWRTVLENRGVTIREHRSVTGFAHVDGRARAAVTDQGELSAEAFVVTTGAWTPLLAGELGCRIPIQPGKGYSITMPRPARCPAIPMIFEEHRVAVTPMDSGYRLGSTMEFAGYDASLNRRRLDALREGASRYLLEPWCEPVEEEWFGWRPMTYDSRPIIGAAPALANVLIAAGHNMLGLSMAPATGRLVSELLGQRTPHVDPAPYAPTRF
jgi:D-amino-acid dehydrogenase